MGRSWVLSDIPVITMGVPQCGFDWHPMSTTGCLARDFPPLLDGGGKVAAHGPTVQREACPIGPCAALEPILPNQAVADNLPPAPHQVQARATGRQPAGALFRGSTAAPFHPG